jgi:hypothetical protein
MLTWKKFEHPAATRKKELAALENLFSGLSSQLKRPAPPVIRTPAPEMGSLVDFNAVIGEVAPAEFEAAVAELWTKALDEVESAYPSGGWEILVAYVTVETGDVMIYPATMARLDDGSAKVRIILHANAWENAYAALPELEESRKFDAAYRKVLKSIAKTLKQATESTALSPRFRALKTRSSFGIYYVDAVETIRRESLQFLWGNKAPDGLPSGSAKELFEALLLRQSSYIRNSMVFEGDVLCTVKLQGANYNDKYVDWLEAVPNVGEICTGLREILLMATRIKPPAVERLRKLFPGVDVQVLAYKNDVGWVRKDV